MLISEESSPRIHEFQKIGRKVNCKTWYEREKSLLKLYINILYYKYCIYYVYIYIYLYIYNYIHIYIICVHNKGEVFYFFLSYSHVKKYDIHTLLKIFRNKKANEQGEENSEVLLNWITTW